MGRGFSCAQAGLGWQYHVVLTSKAPIEGSRGLDREIRQE